MEQNKTQDGTPKKGWVFKHENKTMEQLIEELPYAVNQFNTAVKKIKKLKLTIKHMEQEIGEYEQTKKSFKLIIQDTLPKELK